MKKISLLVFLLSVPVFAMAQTAVFTDVFGTSTTNKTSTPTGTPTVSATSYDIACSKVATTAPYCRPGNLRLCFNSTTTSGFIEAQAVFTLSPVVLVTVGDYINLTYTFTNTGGTLLAGGTASYIVNGLYNSGGSIPLAGNLNNSGLNATAGSAYASNNCANWQGYCSRIANGGASQIYTRPLQIATNTTSANQDLVGNNWGGGAFLSPVGVPLGASQTSTVTLASGSAYTISYTIALTDVGTLTVTNNLYAGVGTGGTLVFSQTNAAAGSTNITSSFDGLAIGVRNSGTSLNPTMDISQIAITKNISGSPGPSFSATGGGTGCLNDAFLVGLSGSVTTNVYFLLTNGVYSGVTQAGTGGAFDFPAQTVQSAAVTNTVLASNTVSGFTGLMSGSVVVQAYPSPVVTAQPTTAFVVTNGIAVFSVTASGVGLHYQWYKNGVALLDGSPISGSQTATLTVAPATTAEAAVAANGYYVVITNNCGLATTSITNALTLQPAGNLVWQGGNPNLYWDVATTLNFTNPAGSSVIFNSGDNVTIDDSSANRVVTLVGNLAPSALTYAATQDAFLRGSGTLVGTGSLIANGPGMLTLSNVSTYTYSGGSFISGGTVVIRNGGQQSLGSGPITLSGGTLEVGVASGSSTSGLSNSINVSANSTLKWDGNGTYALVLSGSLTGTSGATLTLQNYLNNSATPDRVRIYGNFTNDSSVVINTAGNQIDLAAYAPSGNQVFNGLISGAGGRFITRAGGSLILNNGGNSFNDSGVSANGNGGSGYSVMFSGGNLGVGADSISVNNPPTIDSSPLGTGKLGINVGVEGGTATLFSSGGAHTVGNEIIYTSTTNTVTFVIGGSNNLTLSGAFGLNGATGAAGTNRTIQVDNTALTTFSGVVGDNGLGCGLTKIGLGTLVFSGTNTYTGPTTVGRGLLWITGVNGASPITVTNGQLGGTGSIGGAVSIATDGTIAPGGSSIGSLTVNSDLALSGNGFFRVNRSGFVSDRAVVAGTLANNGTGNISITNLGATLQSGDTFTLFNKAVTGGAALTVTGGGMNWSNRLSLDGSVVALTAASSMATNPTNITFSVSGSVLTLSWPADHLGWYLQVQTNALNTGLGTNWVFVPGSSSVVTTNFPVNPANASVFYRLKSSNP